MEPKHLILGAIILVNVCFGQLLPPHCTNCPPNTNAYYGIGATNLVVSWQLPEETTTDMVSRVWYTTNLTTGFNDCVLVTNNECVVLDINSDICFFEVDGQTNTVIIK